MSVTSWTLTIIGLLTAPVTGGASLLLALPLAKQQWDKSDNQKKKMDAENRQNNTNLNNQASKELQDEIAKLRAERDKQDGKNKKTEDQLHDFKQKLANRRPRAIHETDDWLKKQIVVLQDQLDKDKGETKNLSKRIEELTKRMPHGNSSNWTLPELLEIKTSTKVILASATVLLVYLIFSKDKRQEK